MRIPQIQVRQGYAKIDLRIEKPTVDIQQSRAELNITQKPAEMSIQKSQSSLEIDTTEARANLDMKSAFRRTEEFAGYGQQKALEAIEAKSAEGDRMARIENKGDTIASMAADHLFADKAVEAIGYNPNYITIRFNPSELKIDWKINGKQSNPVIHKPVITYKPGKVETYLKQKNWIQIEVSQFNQTM